MSIISSFGLFSLYRWKKFEIHDIVIECAKVSLDPKEASCEEGYASMPEHFCAHLQQRPADCTASPYGDFHSSYGNTLILSELLNLRIQQNSTSQCFIYPRDGEGL